MKAPSHYLKQCGLIIKLINRVPWHLSQWIILRYQSVRWDWDLYVGIISASAMKSFIYSEVIIALFVIAGNWYLLSQSLILLASVYSRGTRYPAHVSFVSTPQGGNVPRRTVAWRVSHIHERLWPPLLKLKFENDWLPSNYRGSSCKKINSGFQFQFQFQFQGFQFQFHFQFHQFQFQFQFQFQNWNWNWAAIPIPELNWPQPCWLKQQVLSRCSD